MANRKIAKKTDRVVEMLHDAAKIREERGLLYDNGHHGGAYKHHGHVMAALFPDGISAQSPEELNRLGVLNMIVGKLVRYAGNYDIGGHDDSLADLAVYSQMLRELDEISRG